MERVRLSEDRHLSIEGQVIEKGANFNGPHVARVAFLMKQTELATPVTMALDDSVAVVLSLTNDRQLVEQPGSLRGRRNRSPLA